MDYLNPRSQDSCLSISELHAIARRGTKEGAEHLAACSRCQALVRMVERQGKDTDPALTPVEVDRKFLATLVPAEIPDRRIPDEWSFGELMAISARGADELMICALLNWSEATTTLEVAPITGETLMAAEWDLLLGAADSSLGYEVAAEVWNRGAVDVGQVHERLGKMGDGAKAQLQTLAEAVNTGDHRLQPRTGVPVDSEEDPRLVFQIAEAERVSAYWVGTDSEPAIEAEDAAAVVSEAGQPGSEPALDPAVGSGATAALSIGQWFARWLNETGYDPEDLAREASWRVSDVELLLADRVGEKPQLLFNADHFARLLAVTDVDEYEGEDVLYTRVPAAMFAEAAPSEHSGAVFRRGSRPGMSRPGASPPETVTSGGSQATEKQVQAFRAWVTAVLDALSDHRAR